VSIAGTGDLSGHCERLVSSIDLGRRSKQVLLDAAARSPPKRLDFISRQRLQVAVSIEQQDLSMLESRQSSLEPGRNLWFDWDRHVLPSNLDFRKPYTSSE
jgi:hypothetical protein